MTPEPVPPPSIAAGSVFGGRYSLSERIAGGGMGEVWRATDAVLHRDVAVKFLREEFADDDMFRERLRREARAAGSISHPGVVPVFDYGEFVRDNGAHIAYIVMELVDGPSLATVLKDGALSIGRAATVLEQTALALQSAHDAGVVHRDIKPANILITPSGDVKLTDFGISHAADAMPITRTGVMVGTASYLSPEQAGGQQATTASDIYSLGVVAYTCLTGEVPFSEGNDISVALAHIRDRPAELSNEVPSGFRDLVMQMLEKDPEERPASAAAIAAMAATVLAVHTSVDSPIPAAETDNPGATRVDMALPAETARRRRRIPLAAAAILLIAAVLLIVVIGVLSRGSGGTRVPDVMGEQRSVAVAHLKSAGLVATLKSSDVAGKRSGEVIGQSVQADSTVDEGTTILLTIASGKVVVPGNLEGLNFDAAATLLKGLGLVPKRTTAESTKSSGTVLAVSPEGRIATGATVRLTVAVAPAPAATPRNGKGGKGKKGH